MFAEFLGGSFFSSLDNLNGLSFTSIILEASFSKECKRLSDGGLITFDRSYAAKTLCIVGQMTNVSGAPFKATSD